MNHGVMQTLEVLGSGAIGILLTAAMLRLFSQARDGSRRVMLVGTIAALIGGAVMSAALPDSGGFRATCLLAAAVSTIGALLLLQFVDDPHVVRRR
jgi:predicted MFS family arabinose efflux permease